MFAHAMTSHPNVIKKRSHYLMGGCLIDEFYKDGVDGYISFVGHTPTENVIWTDQGLYLDDDLKSIWKMKKKMCFFWIVAVDLEMAGWRVCVLKQDKDFILRSNHEEMIERQKWR